jgi:hypothetical protein
MFKQSKGDIKMSNKMSILRALRERKTIANEIEKASTRAQTNAVATEDETPDFNVDEQIALHSQKQYELRALKCGIAAASLSTLVNIPNDVSVPEAGKQVPVYQAILIRDDLKGRKKFLEGIEKSNTAPDIFALRTVREGQEPKKRIRKFDFAKILSDIDKLQTAIDEIDAAIQYADSTTQISI